MIQIENIHFQYAETQVSSLRNVSLEIPNRECVLLCGESSCGKTTLCHLLSRFWDVDSGIVTLGGGNIKEYSMDALMKNFSFVFHNVYLFKDTVAKNIRFGQPNALMEEVISAAKKARCHDFIMALPNGYDTVIVESGCSLSGGERQRLSIARAMMKNAPSLFWMKLLQMLTPKMSRSC